MCEFASKYIAKIHTFWTVIKFISLPNHNFSQMEIECTTSYFDLLHDVPFCFGPRPCLRHWIALFAVAESGYCTIQSVLL